MAFPKCRHCEGTGSEPYCNRAEWPADLPKDACHLCGGYGYRIPQNRYPMTRHIAQSPKLKTKKRKQK